MFFFLNRILVTYFVCVYILIERASLMGFTRLIVTMLIRKLEVVELSDLTELNTLNSMNVPLFTKSCPRILFVQIQV